LDRTARDVSIILDIYKRVIQAGGVLVLSDGMTFADNPNDRLMLTVLGGVAEQEKTIIRDRTCKGRRARAQEGQQVSRSLRPYGFIIVTKAMVLTGQAKPEELGKYLQHPDEAPWVRFMFEQYAGGASLRQVALSLHGMGVPTARGGKEWEPETIAGILRNPAHKGAATFGRERRIFDETRWMNGLKTSHYNRPAPAEEVVTIPTPAIVDEATWETANTRLEYNKTALRGRRDRRWLLTGLFRCAHCGLSMKGHRMGKRDRRETYSCPHYSAAQTARRHVCDSTRYEAAQVEAAVLEGLARMVNEPASLTEAFAAFAEQREQQQPADTDKERAQVEAALSELTKRERAAVEAQITGIAAGMNPAVYAQAFADMAAERERLNRRLAALGTAAEAKQSRAELTAAARQLVKQLAAVVDELLAAPELTAAEKHGLLSRLIRRITVAEDGDTLRIETHGSRGADGTENVAVICVSSVTRAGSPSGAVGPPGPYRASISAAERTNSTGAASASPSAVPNRHPAAGRRPAAFSFPIH
jgi:site-specific DNA recombinase